MTGGRADRDARLGAARRADWRFLLEDPEPARVALVGPADEGLRAALAACCHEPVHLSAPAAAGADAAFDLVVVTSPRTADVREAARLVASAGTLRWESRGGPSSRAAREALVGCGLEDVHVHWHRPRFEDSLEAIPLDAPRVLDHVLRGGTHGRAGEMRRAVARVLRAAGLLERVAACRGVVGRRGPSLRPGLPERLRTLAAPRGGEADGVRLLLRTPRFRASGHVLLFAFPKDAREPTLVAKIARLPGPSPSLEREASALTALAEVAGGVIGVPGLMERTAAGRSDAIVETIVPGAPVHPAKVRRDAERHLDIFGAWIGDLHRRTRVYAITNGWWQEVVDRPLARIEEFFGSGSREAKLAARTRELVSPLRDVATSWVLEHGDLSAPNLLLDGDRPGVVDWELGTTHGLPAADLFFFLGFVAFARDRAESADSARAALRRAFFGKSPWAAARVRRYAEAVGVPSVQLPSLYVLAWARNVASYLERLTDEGGTPPASADSLRAWLRRERCFAAWVDAVEHFDALNPDGSPRSGS